MITKNINKIKESLTLENVSDAFSMVNTFALSTTESVAVKGINKVSKLQNTLDKAIKNGLAFNAQKQEVIFDALDSGKVILVKNVSKVTKKFSKK
ncbi:MULTISPECIES: hypothetical protein [Tenacibaculum]|uniref:hypothetical protein n=1 Tax=Tenacibaculum TaxID=104267 RepID=UPI001F0A19A0|nr:MULTISPECIES: hypothetical protein [Tenacibaculum]MCH3881550.1 hypothetical protein [Tenacibaculum aquimarinum]MDO6598855.1 hypothetical protein [Tenacibaculum sp. 1_MG-2023]